jgi:hypothetical protein
MLDALMLPRSGDEVPIVGAHKKIAFNTSAETTCAESVYEIQLIYEKTYHFGSCACSRDDAVSQFLRIKERNNDDDHHSRGSGHNYSASHHPYDNDAFG